MLRSYEDESNGLWYPLRTRVGNEEKVLRGFWVDRGMLDAIFAQPGQYDGVRIYFREKGKGRQKGILFGICRYYSSATKDLDSDTGKYYDYVDPCHHQLRHRRQMMQVIIPNDHKILLYLILLVYLLVLGSLVRFKADIAFSNPDCLDRILPW